MGSEGKLVDGEPKWASIHQVTVNDLPQEQRGCDVVGTYEVKVPEGCPVLGVALVGRRLLVSVGVMEHDQDADTETLHLAVRAAGDRFPPRQAGRLIGEVVWADHLLYVFDVSPDELEELNAKFDAAQSLRRIAEQLGKEG